MWFWFILTGMDSMGPMVDGFQHGQPPRQKRVRTSFKHHQLRTMKSYFALNHNPDAKDLKQLAQKTGLSKRVLQVSLLYNTLINHRPPFQTSKFHHKVEKV